MKLSTYSPLLAVAAFGQVATATAPLTCTTLDPLPDNIVCAKTGFVSGDAEKIFSVGRIDKEGCANYCASNGGCQSFSWRDSAGGSCVLYRKALSEVSYNEDDYAMDIWYEMGCFSCSNNALFDVDFSTAENLDDWSMTTESDDTFYFDTQLVSAHQSFRILEASDSGSAVISYGPTFQLEAGASYRLGFMIKTSNPAATDLSLIEMFVATNDEIIFEYSPEQSTLYAQDGDWGIYTPEFTVRPIDAGEGDFSFKITAGGLQLDWFIPYIYLQKI